MKLYAYSNIKWLMQVVCVCVCINNKEREMMNLKGSKGTMRRVEGKQKEEVEGKKTEML